MCQMLFVTRLIVAVNGCAVVGDSYPANKARIRSLARNLQLSERRLRVRHVERDRRRHILRCCNVRDCAYHRRAISRHGDAERSSA